MDNGIDTNGRYVIAKQEVIRDIYGLPHNSHNLRFVQGFTTDPDRVKGWGEKGLSGKAFFPRIHKHYVSDPSSATHFNESDADFFCAVFNLVAARTEANYSFVVRTLDSLI